MRTSTRQPGARVRAVGWGWRHPTREYSSATGLDFEIQPGEKVLLLGASGSGKSTLLQALAGVLGEGSGESTATDGAGEQFGELLIDGVHPRSARGRAGLVLQDPDAGVVLERVGDDIAFGCENLGLAREEIWSRAAEALDLVGLDVPLSHSTSALSGGQKQRLALAGVLAMRPGLLLLDEPTANLDPAGVREVRDAVDQVASSTGATLIVVEHRVATWRDVVDRVIVLGASGGVVADGTLAEILDSLGPQLAAQGIWIPGGSDVPRRPSRELSLPELSPPEFSPRESPVRESPLSELPPRALLSAVDLSVGRRRAEPVALDVSLAVREGECLGITGRNGSGKSTLALTLAGLLAPVGGSVNVHPDVRGRLDPAPSRWRSRQLLGRLGFVFQDPEHQFLATTVRQELAVGPRALGHSVAAIDSAVDELLARLHLELLAEANPFTLSGGEKRRLSVGTALITEPAVLIVDEPTFGQDARTWRELVALFSEQLDAGRALVAVSHDTEFLEALADETVALADATVALP